MFMLAVGASPLAIGLLPRFVVETRVCLTDGLVPIVCKLFVTLLIVTLQKWFGNNSVINDNNRSVTIDNVVNQR